MTRWPTRRRGTPARLPWKRARAPQGAGARRPGGDSAADGSSAVGATDGCALAGVRDGRRTGMAPLPWSPEVSLGSAVTGGAESPRGAARRTSDLREASNDPGDDRRSRSRGGRRRRLHRGAPPCGRHVRAARAPRGPAGRRARVPGGALAGAPAGGAAGGSCAAGWRRGWPRAGFGGGQASRPAGAQRPGAAPGLPPGSHPAHRGQPHREWEPEPQPGGQSLPGPGYRRGWRGPASRASSASRPIEPAPGGAGSGANLEATTGCTRGRVPAPRLRPTSRRQEVGHAPTRSR